MTSSEPGDAEGVLREYFKQLKRALGDLTEDRRDQLVSEIREHVADAMAQRPPDTPWELRELLAKVGTPTDIAAAALAEVGLTPHDRHLGRTLLLSGITLVMVMGLSVGLLIAFAAPTPQNERTRVKIVEEAAPTTSTSTSSTTSTTTSAPTSTPATPTTVPQTTPAPVTLTTTTPPAFAVLAPATVPPKIPECTQQMSFGADGTAGPLFCANGRLNVLAWNYYSFTAVMGLGPYATPQQVVQAICTDPRGTNPIEEDAYHLAAGYYGWNFGYDPTSVLIDGACVGTTQPTTAPTQ